MKFGVCLPHRWVYASSRLIADFAREAEGIGYDSLWVTDHVVVPPSHVERGHIFYEALTTLAFVSSLTESVELGTTVLALPTRNPILLAKQVATLDSLSGGRVILGLGTGWIREELEYLGAPWRERGRILDEGIEVMRHLWRGDGPLSYRGRYVSFNEVLFYPKPARPGGPPIWVGGMSEASLRRAARIADGWLPWAISPEELRSGAEKIERMGGGRRVTLALFAPADIESSSLREYVGVLGERHYVLSGNLDGVSEVMEDFREAGLEHLILSFRDVRLFKDDKPDKLLSQMRLFGKELLPSFKK